MKKKGVLEEIREWHKRFPGVSYLRPIDERLRQEAREWIQSILKERESINEPQAPHPSPLTPVQSEKYKP